MKQILQNLSNGKTTLQDVPCPVPKKGHVLIQSRSSLISAGTERMLVSFGKSNLIDKARSQPDKVKQAFDKVRTDGIMATYQTIQSKLDQPLALGYCNVGIVEDGSDTEFQKGDRVISNGHHAEMVRVPKNLVAKIPDNVDDRTASFTVVGAIALQGIRLASPNVGETIVVMGLGLIGLMAVQILKANGCKVIGIDNDPNKCQIAKEYGIDVIDSSSNKNSVALVAGYADYKGVDAVLITASSKSNEIMHDAATMCRKRGKIVLVGVVGLDLRRDDFYEKELTFQVSCSYGPGRYDENYEQKGIDYPEAYVRWTEQRNFQAILDLMSNKSINVPCVPCVDNDLNISRFFTEKLSMPIIPS